MRLYHSLALFFTIIVLILAGCYAPQVTQGLITVRMSVEDKTAELQVPAGSSVQQVLELSNITLDVLDRTEPPLYTLLKDGSQIQVIRVTEEFIIEESVIPFEKQIVRSESFPADAKPVQLQQGKEGIRETTIRIVYENGIEVSKKQVKSVIMRTPVEEIEMHGSQNPFSPFAFPGKMVYLSTGNAWLMEGTSGNRQQIIGTGDLDGRILRLSPDKNWLLFTRSSDDDGEINTLWAAKIDEKPAVLVDLQTPNVIHFADWVPDSAERVIYSSVESRAAAPGWQANNDLYMIDFSMNGWVSTPEEIIPANSGGLYGWWGMTFGWSADGDKLAFSRPDGIGIVDFEEEIEVPIPLQRILPFNTQGDWAWVPGFSWDGTGEIIYTVNHAASADNTDPESSPLFDLTAIPLSDSSPVSIVPQVGMFAYPVSSPVKEKISGELANQIAYLQAVFPNQSDTSRYRLFVMDRDGSERTLLFPEEGLKGLDPQTVIWSPEAFGEHDDHWIALLYQGNMWMLNPNTTEGNQLTADGLIEKIEWK